jgi:hypothetical protein
MFKNTRNALLMALGLGLSTSAFANLVNYSQDFEGLSASSPTSLTTDGWKVFGNVFTPSGGYIGGYGPFGAPNGGPGFSAVASGESGANTGLQYINIYSDYNNPEHANGNIVEANVFQEQVIGASDLGKIYRFSFDYKASFANGPAGSTRTHAFIKVLNPFAGFSLSAFPRIETTSASNTIWSEGNNIDITIDNSWTGQILQFGFMSTATNYQNSGVFYDNVSFSQVPEPATMLALGTGALVLARKRRKA